MADGERAKKDRLSKFADCGLLVSYTLMPDRLVIYLLGFIPARVFKLKDVAYLRLASQDEVPHWFYVRNMKHFRPAGAAHCPVYVLQSSKRSKRAYLKLRGGAHFRLRSAIGFHRRLAAVRDAAREEEPRMATGS